jgi:hypothetical protein
MTHIYKDKNIIYCETHVRNISHLMCDLYGENYQELHESGRTKLFCFPSAEGEMIPEWFNHQSRGGTFSFWFRGKFPSIMILYSIRPIRPNYKFKLIDYFSWNCHSITAYWPLGRMLNAWTHICLERCYQQIIHIFLIFL